jgi:hypothetical protein
MNATDILTEILRGGLSAGKPSGGKPSGGGGGGGIFKDIFGSGPAAPPQRRPAPSAPSPIDIDTQARELEDMLGVGQQERPSSPSPSSSSPPTHWNPAPPSTKVPPPLPTNQEVSLDPQRRDAEAQILIRAAINAAKADGRLTPEEQRSLLDQLGGASREAIQFLQTECQRPLNVPDFAWSVPLGMEYKVYAVSLAAIDLDTKSESEYLQQLAHGLRLPPEVCTHLHQRYGAPLPGTPAT